MILLSIAGLFFFIFVAYNYSIYIYLFMMLLNLAVVVSLINLDTNPEYKIPWLVITIAVPIFGAVICVLFYARRLTKKEARLMRKIYDEYERAENDSAASNASLSKNLSELSAIDELAGGKARAIITDDVTARVYTNTTSRYFSLGESLFEEMLSDLRSAERYIFMEYFIVDEGELWDKLYAVLKQKANSGVDVRLLYDDIGTMHTLTPKFPKKLESEGIRCMRFGRITPRVSTVHHNRDHRKICVVDGRIAYTGGVNIADEYINRIDRFGHWKDGGVRIEGHAVQGFVKMFLSMWDFTAGRVSNYSEYFHNDFSHFPTDGGYYLPFGSGPNPTYPRHVGKNAFLNIINQSQRYLYITTPYLIIDHAMTEALKCAAMRGVDVVIITPSRADKKLVKIMTRSFYPTLIASGVRIYEYTPGFMHEKILVSDDLYAVVGTINFDYRSFVHHFEDALWMYNTPTVNYIKGEFLKIVSVSEQMDEKNARLTFSQRIAKDLIRIFAPLL